MPSSATSPGENVKELVLDTKKESVTDTRKELV